MARIQAENVVGAVIFFTYIVAALFFTGLIGRDLSRLAAVTTTGSTIKENVGRGGARRKQNIQIFVGLSIFSFASLSYHMLSFLILSFSMWRNSLSTLTSLSLLSVEGPRLIWTWAKQSTLFKDFAQDLVRDDTRFWWTQQALIYSQCWNIYMAVEGTRCRIPHLWAYFVLDQILPICFTQNLFCVALFLIERQPRGNSLLAAAPGDQFMVTFGYLLCLSFIHGTIGTKSFFPMLFAIRALLFAPFWMLRPRMDGSPGPASRSRPGLLWQYRFAISVLAVGGSYLVVRQTPLLCSVKETVQLIRKDLAVAALGVDYLLGIVSLAIFIARLGVQDSGPPVSS